MITGNGTAKKKITNAAAARADKRAALECPLTNLDDSLNHNCENGSLESEEQSCDDGHSAPERIDVAEHHDADDAWQDEQTTGQQAARRFVH